MQNKLVWADEQIQLKVRHFSEQSWQSTFVLYPVAALKLTYIQQTKNSDWAILEARHVQYIFEKCNRNSTKVFAFLSSTKISVQNFVFVGEFILCKAEWPLQGVELQEKENTDGNHKNLKIIGNY